MPPLETAVRELRQILAADSTAPKWRRNVRRRLSEVKEALARPGVRYAEAWLDARCTLSERDRFQLHARVVILTSGVLDPLSAPAIVQETKRLLCDLEHYVQRVHDLVYDSVGLELGGSE